MIVSKHAPCRVALGFGSDAATGTLVCGPLVITEGTLALLSRDGLDLPVQILRLVDAWDVLVTYGGNGFPVRAGELSFEDGIPFSVKVSTL